MGLNRFFLKIRRRESLLYNFLYILLKRISRIEFPCIVPFYRLLYRERQLRISIFRWIGVKIYYEPLFKSQCVTVGKNFRIIRGKLQGIPYIAGDPSIEIGCNATFHSVITIAGNKIFDRPALKIGDNVYIGSRVSISIAKEVKIGNNCYLADNIIIRDNDGHQINWVLRRHNTPISKEDVKPVIINDDVWIGSNSVILKGCTIGRGAIIASGSIVTKSVEPFTIVAGNPAILVKRLTKS